MEWNGRSGGWEEVGEGGAELVYFFLIIIFLEELDSSLEGLSGELGFIAMEVSESKGFEVVGVLVT